MKEHYDKEAAEMKKSSGGKGTTVINSQGEIFRDHKKILGFDNPGISEFHALYVLEKGDAR